MVIDIIENIMITFICCLSQYICVGTILNRGHITKKKIIRYSIYFVVFVLPGYFFAESEGHIATFGLTIWIACFLYDGTIMQKVAANFLGVTYGLCMNMATSIVLCGIFKAINQLDSLKQMMSNLLFGETVTFIGVYILIRILKLFKIFDDKVIESRRLTFKRCLRVCIACTCAMNFTYMGGEIREIGFRNIVNYERFGNDLIATAFVLVFVLIIGINDDMTKEYYKWINKIIQNQVKRQLKFYQRLESMNKETRAIKHDMKNHLIVISKLASSGEVERLKEYIKEIEQTTNKLDNMLHTGNTIVDAIINEKIELAKKKSIKFDVDIRLPNDIGIDAMDICIFMANSIDNALEACEAIEDPEKRHIAVMSYCKGGYFIYNIKNTSNKGVKIINNQVTTSKNDHVNHGYGIINMQRSAEKYDGTAKIEYKENYFYVYIDIPIKNTQQVS